MDFVWQTREAVRLKTISELQIHCFRQPTQLGIAAVGFARWT